MRYRHEWPGILLLGSLAFLLGALIVWGDHFLSPGPSGGIRRLLQLWAASRPPASDAVSAIDRAGPAAAERLVRSGSEDTPRSDEPTAVPSASGASAPVDLRVAPPPTARATATTADRAQRYALDLGSFLVVEEAERAEAQLNQAGFSTVRFRQQEPARLFSVWVSLPAGADEHHPVVERLRDAGLTDASAPVHTSSLRVAHGLPLHTAVLMAERVRAAGHEPKVTAEAARVGPITLRHGSFTSREEAEAVGREISRLGVAAEVVRIP